MERIPDFMKVRDATVLDAITYFNKVMPVCREILTLASVFFKNFNSDYEDYETFIEDFDDIRLDVESYKIGFTVCQQMHHNVATQAYYRKL